MAFHEVRLDTSLEYGYVGGPHFLVDKFESKNGWEQRVLSWAQEKRSFRVGFGLRSMSEFHDLQEFWYERRGETHGFRFRDFHNFCTDQVGLVAYNLTNATEYGYSASIIDTLPPSGLTKVKFGEGNASDTEFQLYNLYPPSGAVNQYSRMIVKPVIASGTGVRIYVDGSLQSPTGTPPDYTLDTTNGTVTFNAAPGSGLDLEWDGFFDLPVRFQGKPDWEIEFHQLHNWRGLVIQEIRQAGGPAS